MAIEAIETIRQWKARQAQQKLDWETREAMLDAYYLHYWEPDEAWRQLVGIVARYTRETERVKKTTE